MICVYPSLQSNITVERPRTPRLNGPEPRVGLEPRVGQIPRVHKNTQNVYWHLQNRKKQVAETENRRKQVAEAKKLLKEHRSNQLEGDVDNNQIDWRSKIEDENNWIPVHPILSEDLDDLVNVYLEEPQSNKYLKKNRKAAGSLNIINN